MFRMLWVECEGSTFQISSELTIIRFELVPNYLKVLFKSE